VAGEDRAEPQGESRHEGGLLPLRPGRQDPEDAGRPAPAREEAGLRGKIVANKTEEMKEELQATVALIQQYVPPDSDQIQVVMNSAPRRSARRGHNSSRSTSRLREAGDALTITFDKAVTALHQMTSRVAGEA